MEFIFEPELEIELPWGLDLTAIGSLRTDAYNRLETGVPSQSEVSGFSRRLIIGDRTDLELRQFYIRASLGRTFLTVGKQQIVWGLKV